MKKAVYAGSFDPITNGHLWIIEQGTKIFDTIVVAVGENSGKDYTFTQEERLNLVTTVTKKFTNVEVISFRNQFLVNFAHQIGADFIIRGIRNYTDYDYEKSMRHVNSDLSPTITTIFLMPPRNYAELSSSLVKNLIGSSGWQDLVSKYVPDCVLNKMIKHEKQRSLSNLPQ